MKILTNDQKTNWKYPSLLLILFLIATTGVIIYSSSFLKEKTKGILILNAPPAIAAEAPSGQSQGGQLSLLFPPFLPRELFVGLSKFIFFAVLLPLLLLNLLLFSLSERSFIQKSEKGKKMIKLILKISWIFVIVLAIMALFSFIFSFTREPEFEHSDVIILFRGESLSEPPRPSPLKALVQMVKGFSLSLLITLIILSISCMLLRFIARRQPEEKGKKIKRISKALWIITLIIFIVFIVCLVITTFLPEETEPANYLLKNDKLEFGFASAKG